MIRVPAASRECKPLFSGVKKARYHAHEMATHGVRDTTTRHDVRSRQLHVTSLTTPVGSLLILRLISASRAELPPGQVAQLVEQRTENPRVGGSIPPLATI